MNDIYIKDCGEYTIQSLTDDYLQKFMFFFSENLNPANLLSNNKAFIQKQFYNNHLQTYNFLIAVDKENFIIGAIGFVDTEFYDSKTANNFVWLTNWLVSKTKHRMVGLHLLYSIFDYKKGCTFGTVGNNDVSANIYKQLGFTSGQLVQYFMVNDTLSHFKLLQGYTHAKTTYSKGCMLTNYNEQHFDDIKQSFPCKSKIYVENKYIKNQFYKYDIFTIQNNKIASGILVVKTDEYNKAKALRIVDFIGDLKCLFKIGDALQTLLKDKNAEYIDFYCHGIDKGILLNSGFTRNDMHSDLIVPCYFEPFCPVNVPIYFCYQTNQPFTIFKGDGDRDFPKILNL